MSCWQVHLLCLRDHVLNALASTVAAAAILHWHQNPALPAFQRELMTCGCPGVRQSFGTRFGLLRPPALWTQHLLVLSPSSEKTAVIVASYLA